MTVKGVRRLNWGSGTVAAPDWINADLVHAPGVEICGDIRNGLPLADDDLDYAFSSHALQQLPFLDVEPALRELLRVLRPGGVLRLGLPDLDRALEAWRTGDRDYFLVPDADARSISTKFVVQMTWYGSSAMLFNFDVIDEMLRRAGFREVLRCVFGQTRSRFSEIVELDNRERETLFVEAWK